jgi:transcriptional regulator with XRE-family HTH domain
MATVAKRAAREEDLAKLLGEDVRGLRKAHGMTLEELAAKVHLSVGFLSQMENGKKKPSIGALQRISEALNVPTGSFFRNTSADDPKELGVVVRRENRRRLFYSALGSTDYLKELDYLLSPTLDGKLLMTLVEYEPGGSTGDDLYTHEGEECGFVLCGVMELHHGGDVFTLRAGDSWAIKGGVPHRYANPGHETTRIVMVNTPVMIRY